MGREKPGDRVTMHDVAERAGVSQPTVSLVLAGRPGARVAEQTRERVLRAAEALGYRPNLLARGLVRRRSYALGVLVADLSDPFFADVVRGTQRVASEEGYAVILCETRGVPAERHLEALRARLIDGVLIDARSAEAVPEETLSAVNPMLLDVASERWPSVVSDAPGAGRLAARHLLDLGHRRIGFLGPPLGTYAFRLRERGFVRGLRDGGASLPSRLLVRVRPTAAGGQAGMRVLLAADPRPTGVFCASDPIAVGALKACRAAGVAVPGEVSLVGCDDSELARLACPELTTIGVPAAELGARAARYLIRRLDEEEGELHQWGGGPLGVRLVVRDSTAAPRAGPPEGSPRRPESVPAAARRAGDEATRVRGAVVTSTLDYLRHEGGEATLVRVMGRLPVARRREVEAVGAADEVPVSLAWELWRAADRVLGRERPDWAERAGAFAVETSDGTPTGVVPGGVSPQEISRRAVALFRSHHRSGALEVAFERPGHVVVRLVGFDGAGGLFCRRQTGALRRALELAGGEGTTAAHVRCGSEGDAFCEWGLRWTRTEQGDPGEGAG